MPFVYKILFSDLFHLSNGFGEYCDRRDIAYSNRSSQRSSPSSTSNRFHFETFSHWKSTEKEKSWNKELGGEGFKTMLLLCIAQDVYRYRAIAMTKMIWRLIPGLDWLNDWIRLV